MRRGILSSLPDDDYLGLAFLAGRCGESATICHATWCLFGKASVNFSSVEHSRYPGCKSIKAFQYVRATRSFD
jgi:hypothetical protein